MIYYYRSEFLFTNVAIIIVSNEKHIESVVVARYPNVSKLLVSYGNLRVRPPYVKP